jgi:hypothetical protein
MPMTFDGSGTITGLAAGGLPNSSVITADIADAAITAAKLDGAQSGSAPIYGARAWVNFNGSGTVAIRASGNVSSITDNGTGDYTVNFTTAMLDASFVANASGAGNIAFVVLPTVSSNVTVRSFYVSNLVGGGTFNDSDNMHVAIFR